MCYNTMSVTYFNQVMNHEVERYKSHIKTSFNSRDIHEYPKVLYDIIFTLIYLQTYVNDQPISDCLMSELPLEIMFEIFYYVVKDWYEGGLDF